MTEPKQYKLKLTFDARQMTVSLQNVILLDGVSSMNTSGAFAGSYTFDPGDTLDIEVVALTHGESVVSLKDLTLVCVPAGSARQPFLSPYDTESAGYVIREWNEGTATEVDGNPAIVFTSKAPLSIIAPYGEWEMMGYLSVLFPRADRIDAQFCRVFDFDPSVVVGGGNPPN